MKRSLYIRYLGLFLLLVNFLFSIGEREDKNYTIIEENIFSDINGWRYESGKWKSKW